MRTPCASRRRDGAIFGAPHMLGGMSGIRRHDPYGGAYGAALATGAGDFVFTSVAGVIELRDGSPVFAVGFEAQLRLAGRHVAAELAEFGFATPDIVESTVFVHPDVEIDPEVLLDLLQADVFAGTVPALSITRSASLYEESLIVIKVTAFRASA
jgi:enamine deaminase RidA (YjgF/YER057c/UK114 family)